MEMQVKFTQERRRDLLDALRIYSALFWGADMEKCRSLHAGDDFLPLENLVALMAPPAGEACAALKNLVQAFPGPRALCAHLSEDYIPLFVNARGGIAAPLYQSCYPAGEARPGSATLMGDAAVRMQARFRDRGLNLDNGLNEPPDHLAIEVEYLFFLLEKGWRENDAALLAEAADFAGTEMLAWLPEFEKRLQAAAAGSFYALLTNLLIAILRLIAQR